MTVFGIKRKVDSLGRIVLPKEYRELYGINDNDTVEMIATDKGILLRKTGCKLLEITEE